jgi:hypothetical protein
MDKGPRGVHVWRQCNTLSVARNFYQEDMHILKPRVDNRKGTNGRTGTAFPLFEYVLAVQYKLFGFTNSGHRWLQLSFTALLIFGGFYLGKLLFENLISAGIMAWVLAWSPDLYYHGINALPDVSALAFSTWALFFYFKFKASTKLKWAYLFAFFVVISLAGLVKLQYLMFGGVALIDSILSQKRAPLVPMVISLFAASLPSFFWYTHAIQLRKTSGLVDYGLLLNPADSISEALTILWRNISSDMPEILLGYAAVPIFSFGLYIFWKSGDKKIKAKALLAFIGLTLFHLIELDQMDYHGYYMMPYILFLAMICAFGFRATNQLNLSLKRVVLLILMAQPILTFARIDHRFTNNSNAQIPSEFLNTTKLDSLKNAVNKSHQVLMYGDPSGCIFFYYLECKGWNAGSSKDLELSELIEAIHVANPSYLVLYEDKKNNALWDNLGSWVQIGNFVIIDLP